MGSKKKQTRYWVCPANCKDWRKKPCKHLEKMLPKDNSEKATPIHFVDNLQSEPVSKIRVRRFIRKISQFGLEDIRVDVLTLRFVYGCTVREISQYLSIPSERTVQDILRKSLDMLKERGYK